MMDCEKLILLVQERKYLWDQREKNYYQRNVQKQLWQEVSTKMKSPEDDVKRKWRGLRDTFRRVFIKQKKIQTDNGGHASQPPSWPFFSQLLFLTDAMKPTGIESNVPFVESDDLNMNSDDMDLDEELFERGGADLPSTPQTSRPTSGAYYENVDDYQQTYSISKVKKELKNLRKKNKCLKTDLSNFDQEPLEDKTKKVKYLEGETTRTPDGDYHFLMSLLPYLHDIPKKNKLFVRQKIMNVVMEEVSQQNFGFSSQSALKYSSDDSSSIQIIMS